MSHECEGQCTRPLCKTMCNYDEIMQQIDVVACCKARQLSCTILLKPKHVYINAIQARKEKTQLPHNARHHHFIRVKFEEPIVSRYVHAMSHQSIELSSLEHVKS